MFPEMSTKDRLMGWVAMALWCFMAYAPLAVCRISVSVGYPYLVSGPLGGSVVSILAGLSCSAWCWRVLLIGAEMATKQPDQPKQGLRPGDKQPWKHGGGW